jgi:hypothetical protein
MSRQVKSGEVKAAQIMFVLILGLLWASEVYSQGTYRELGKGNEKMH